MFYLLHTAYRRAPAPLRKVLVHLSPLARMVLAPLTTRVEIGGATMFLSPKDNACFRYLKWGKNYEAVTVSALRSIALHPGGKVFFDVGAAYGFYSLALAASVPADYLGQIIAFEPDQRCVDALRKSVAFNKFGKRIAVEHAIAGDVEGSANLLVSNRASTSNRTFQTDEGVFKTVRSVAVRATSIDATFAPPTGDYIAIFKIDVEGNEARVLRGAMNTIQKAKGWAILFEFYPVGMAEVHQPRSSIIDICKSLQPDWIYVERPDRLERLGGMDALVADMATHADTPDYRGLGTAANYLVGRSIPPL